jgi:hypothetical protein
MARQGKVWVSAELGAVLARLTPQQAAGVQRIVEAELQGRSLSSLLDCPEQICTSTTYYGSGKSKGWKHKPEFNLALDLARRDYRRWLLDNGVGDALVILANAAPDAARALQQAVKGDGAAVGVLEELLRDDDANLRKLAALQLAATGLPSAVPALRAALQQEKESAVREALVEALGQIAAARDGDRRAAAISVLDRADVKTAAKQAHIIDEGDIDAAIERELARVAGIGQAPVSTKVEGDAGP